MLVCHLIFHNSLQVLNWIEIWAVLGLFQYTDLVFLQELSGYLWLVTRSAILHKYHASMDKFQLFFKQFHVLVVLGGMKHRPAAPWHDMTPQIIWLGGCFIVATTYRLSKHSPNGRLMCMWWGTDCCVVRSESNTFFHSAKIQWQCRLVKYLFLQCEMWLCGRVSAHGTMGRRIDSL